MGNLPTALTSAGLPGCLAAGGAKGRFGVAQGVTVLSSGSAPVRVLSYLIQAELWRKTGTAYARLLVADCSDSRSAAAHRNTFGLKEKQNWI